MSTFQSNMIEDPVLRSATDAAYGSNSAARINDAVRATRATQDPNAVNQRRVPRMSIDEINATDTDTLREKYLDYHHDDRGPVEKFMDALDLPRNTLMHIIAPGLEQRARERGEVGAFGQGRVQFSDVLNEMGMRPGIVRGVLGLVGDVALDPLTYLGGVGLGSRITTAGGKSLRFGSQLMRDLKHADSAAATGRAIGSESLAALHEAMGAPTDFTRAVMGDVKAGKGLIGNATGKLNRILGGDREFSGGILAKLGGDVPSTLQDEATQKLHQAVQKVIGDYGVGSGPRLAIGRTAAGKLAFEMAGRGPGKVLGAGSGIAHIPWTDWGVFVPGFTTGGQDAASALRQAWANSDKSQEPATSARIVSGMAGFDAFQKDSDAFHQYLDRRSTLYSDPAQRDALDSEGADFADKFRAHADHLAAIQKSAEDAKDTNPYGVLALKPTMEKYQAGLNSASERLTALDTGQRLREILNNGPSDPAKLSAYKTYRESLDDSTRALLDAGENDPKGQEMLADQLHREMQANIHASMIMRDSALKFLTPEQQRLTQIQKDFLGTHSDIVGASAMTPMAVISRALFRGNDDRAVGFLAGVDSRLRGYFGGDTGRVGDFVRHAAFMGSRGANAAMNQVVFDAAKDLHSIAKAHGLTSNLDELQVLAHSIMYKERGENAVHMVDVAGNPTGFMQTLKEAIGKGLLNNDLHPGLYDDLRNFATKHIDNLMPDITQKELQAGILEPEQIASGYIAGEKLTPQGRERLGRVAASNPLLGGGTAQKAFRSGVESFQKKVTSRSAMFDSALTGKREEVFDADRWTQKISDEALNEVTDKEVAGWIKEHRDLLDEYDRFPEADKAPMLRSDPMRMNQLIKDGRFNVLLGSNEVPGGFFDTNLITALASRVGSHERAMGKQMLRSVLQDAMVPISKGQFQKMIGKVGAEIDIGGGVTGKVIRLKNQNGIKIGDGVFRSIDKSLFSDFPDSPMLAALGQEGKVGVYHTHVADAIENSVRTFESSDFFKYVDRLTSMWKSMTLLHPSFPIGNFIGDSMNMAIRNPHFLAHAIQPKNIANAIRMLMFARNPEELTKIKMGFGGATGADVMQMLKGDRVLGANLFSEPSIAGLRDGLMLPSRMGTKRAGMTRAGLMPDWEKAVKYAAIGEGKGDTASKADAAYRLANDRMHQWLLDPWHHVNERAQDVIRLMAYNSLREKGYDHENAVRQVVQSMFDYQDMTGFERTYLRRLFPFYAWMKNNAVYQARMLLNRPIYAGAFPSVQRAIEEAADGEERIPTQARPQWMREGLAIQFGSNPDTRSALLVGSWLPQEQAYWGGRLIDGTNGVQDALKQVASNLNPIVRTGLEIGFGKEIGTDRTIGQAGEADMTVPEAVIKQLRTVREAGKLVQAGEQGGAQAVVGRALAGGRFQPFGDDRIHAARRREFMARADGLQKAIRTAESRNNKADSVLYRAQLIRLYSDMEQAGIGEDVPAWAKRRIQEFAGAGTPA